MAFTTESNYTGNGSNKDFLITFPFLEDGDVKVRTRPSGGSWTTQTVTTHYTITGNILTFVTAPVNNADVQVFRDTNIDKTKVTFQTGASIRAQDLNNIAKQFLYAAQEFEQASTTPSGTGLALTTGSKNHITVNSANDWTVTSLGSNSVDSGSYVDGSIDHEHLANDIIDSDNIQDNAIGAEHLKSNSVGFSELIADSVNGNIIQDDSINSEHYVDGSIDHQHLANDVIDSDNIQDNSIGNEHMKDDAIGVAELSASGTASSTTYLRGDNSWADPSSLSLFTAYAILKQVENNGTDAGGSGTDWTDRVINNEIDPSSIVSISSNQFTLGAGNYLIKFSATFWDTEDCRLRIYDVTNGSEKILGGNGYGATAYMRNNWVHGVGRLTPTGSTTYKLQGKCDNGRANNGHGAAASFGTNEEYVQIEIYKES